jgi:Ca2+-binding EF-hand superfamily protein
MRHSIAVGRIERNLRKVNTMIHVLPPPTHDEVILPSSTSEGGNKAGGGGGGEGKSSDIQFSFNKEGSISGANDLETTRSRYKLIQSSAMVGEDAAARMRPLDRAMIDRLVDKVERATMGGPERERSEVRLKLTRAKSTLKKVPLNSMCPAETLRENAERKLMNAVKSKFREGHVEEEKGSANMSVGAVLDTASSMAAKGAALAQHANAANKVKALTTRALLPFYKLDDVKSFMDIFAKVDTDFSGDLDMDEWLQLFSNLRKNVNPNESRSIFLKMDKDGDNLVTISELVPVLFSQASKEQQHLIVKYTMMFLNKKQERVTKLSTAELDQLFDAYDVENIGFVSMGYIRERIKQMAMPEPVVYSFLTSIADADDDEMVNHAEFARILKAYTIKPV